MNRVDNNIFRYIGKQGSECMHLNKVIEQPAFCEKDSHDNIVKYFGNYDILKWESHIYLTFLTTNIFPLCTIDFNKLVYHTKNMTSLRNILKANNNLSFIFNELFSHINSFKHILFTHGNLNVDTIYVKDLGASLQFAVIDYSKSQSKVDPKYDDLLSLYISIKLHFVHNIKALKILDCIIAHYVPKNVLVNSKIMYCHYS